MEIPITDRYRTSQHKKSFSSVPQSPKWSSLISRGLSLQFNREDARAPMVSSSTTSLNLRPSWLNSTVKPSVGTGGWALRRLDDKLDEFCKLLADPTSRNVTKACNLIDKSVATATSPSSPRSPHSPKHMSGSPTSPRLSPRLWLPSSPKESPPLFGPSKSALALEEEWDHYVTPLLFLAAAESIFANMIHCAQDTAEESLKVAASLEGLYQRITNDLQDVKQTLCDPLLGSNHQAAISVAPTLSALTAFATLRIQHIGLQLSLFATSDLPKSTRAFYRLQQAIPTNDLGATTPLFEALQQHVQTSLYFMEACIALTKCQFTETILNLKLCRDSLPAPSTRYSKWIRVAHSDVLAMLPIYFDRFTAESSITFGMDFSKLFHEKPSYHDIEVEMIDLLKRQEKLGGPVTSIVMLLDTVGSSNTRMMAKIPKGGDDDVVEVSQLDLWPPMYARSSLHLPHSIQRIASSKSSHSGSRNLLWSSENSPTSTRKEQSANPTASKILEYPPDTGDAYSWPYSEWNALLRHLHERYNFDGSQTGSNQARFIEEILATTYHHEETKLFGDDGLIGSIDASTMASSEILDRSGQGTSTSTFHVVSISDYLSMVVAVKDDEEGKSWKRRRSKLTDAEIRQFLDSMAEKLRVSTLFTIERVQLQSKSPKIPELPEDTEWSDEDVIEFSKRIKDTFELRPAFNENSSLRPVVRNFDAKTPVINTARNIRGRPSRKAKPSMPESAAALFLGPDLSKVIF